MRALKRACTFVCVWLGCQVSGFAAPTSRDSASEQGHQRTLISLVRNGKQEQALQSANRLLDRERPIGDKVATARCLHILGMVEFECAMDSQAVSHLREAVSNSPQNLEYVHDLLWALDSCGQSNEAEVIATDCRKKWPHDLDLLDFSRASADSYLASLEFWQTQLAREPGNEDAFNQVIGCLLKTNRPDEALREMLNRVSRTAAESARFARMTLQCGGGLFEDERSIKLKDRLLELVYSSVDDRQSLNRFVKLARDVRSPRTRLAVNLLQKKYEKGVLSLPEDQRLEVTVRQQVCLEELVAAESSAKRALALNESNWSRWSVLAAIQARLGHYEDANKSLCRYGDLTGWKNEALIRLAVICAKQRNFAKVQSLVSRLTSDREPSSLAVFLGLAEHYWQERRADLAAAYLKRAMNSVVMSTSTCSTVLALFVRMYPDRKITDEPSIVRAMELVRRLPVISVEQESASPMAGYLNHITSETRLVWAHHLNALEYSAASLEFFKTAAQAAPYSASIWTMVAAVAEPIDRSLMRQSLDKAWALTQAAPREQVNYLSLIPLFSRTCRFDELNQAVVLACKANRASKLDTVVLQQAIINSIRRHQTNNLVDLAKLIQERAVIRERAGQREEKFPNFPLMFSAELSRQIHTYSTREIADVFAICVPVLAAWTQDVAAATFIVHCNTSDSIKILTHAFQQNKSSPELIKMRAALWLLAGNSDEAKRDLAQCRQLGLSVSWSQVEDLAFAYSGKMRVEEKKILVRERADG